jgi:methionyl-tRNA formyltransferase
VATIEAIGAGTIDVKSQNESGATWAPPLARAEAPIDWGIPAADLAARIRGLNPWPMAETGLRGERLHLLRAVAEPAAPLGAAAAPGTVVEAAAARLIVACGGGTRLRLLELRRPGRRALTAREAINGRLVGDGDRFAPIGG